MDNIDELKKDAERAYQLGDKDLSLKIYKKIDSLSSSDWENNAPVEGMKQPEQSTLEKAGIKHLSNTAQNLYDLYNIAGGVRQGLASPAVGLLNKFAPKENNLSNLVTENTNKWELPGLPLENKEAGLYKLGEVAGTVVPATAALKGAGLVAKGLGATPELVEGITSGGIEGGKAIKDTKDLASYILRAGGLGAGTGVATQAVINPNSSQKDYINSGALGAIMPLGLNTLGVVGRFGADLVSGGLSKTNAKAVLEKVMGDKLEASKQALESLPTDTNLTTGQALHGISDPKVASLEEMGRITNGQPFLNKDIAQRQEWVNANKVVSPNLEPAVAHEANVNLAREAELNALQGTKEQDLANRIREFERGTAKETPQFGLGETLVARRKENLKQAKAPFNDVYDESGNLVSKGLYTELAEKYPQKFSVAPIHEQATGILSDLKNQLNPTLAKPIISIAENIFGPTASTLRTEIKQLPRGQVRRTVGSPSEEKEGTLGQMHDLLSAIGEAERKIKNDPNQATAFYNLGELKDSVNKAITAGLPEDALKEYKNLSSQYKLQVADPFYKGITGDISRVKGNQAPAIAPEDIATKYLSESNAQSFNKAFGKDPQAIQALRTGIEQKMMNSPNPEKFLQDNRFALDTLGPEIKTNLNALAEKIRTHGAEGKALEAERSAIPKTVLTESEQAASPANQARLLKEGIETALPNINEGSLNKLNPEAFLSFMRNNRGNIENQLTDIGQQGSLNQIRSNMIRNQEMQAMAKANREPVEKIIEDESFRQRLPSLINPAIAFLNMGIRQTEGKISGATGRELSQAMSDPKYALELFKHLPADQRMALLRNLRALGPTLSRAAIAETNQQ